MAAGDAWNHPGFCGVDLGGSPIVRDARVRSARRIFPAVGAGGEEGPPWILIPLSFSEEEVQAALRCTWEEWGAGSRDFQRIVREGREAAITSMLEEEWERVRPVDLPGWGAREVYSRSGPRRG